MNTIKIQVRTGVVGMSKEQYLENPKLGNYLAVVFPDAGDGGFYVVQPQALDFLMALFSWDGNGDFDAEVPFYFLTELSNMDFVSEFNVQGIIGGAVLGGINWMSEENH
jgi:hypothetical protein